VINAGAVPVFADVELESGNISAQTISKVITSKTKAVIPVHLAGWPCDMDPIMDLAKKHNFKVIEDCAQAHGARYKGRSVGSIGHIGAWSFCQDKIMTTGGEGGMVTCHDKQIWSRMWAHKDHGKSFEAVYERQHPPGFRWLHESFGTNWRMLEMQAVIGRYQLKKMPVWTNNRANNARELTETLLPFAGDQGAIRIPKFACGMCNSINSKLGCVHANYKYYVYVRPENLIDGWNRDRIVSEIVKLGIPAFQGSCSEVYKEKCFEYTGWRPKVPLINAGKLGETSLMFLIHPSLSSEDIVRSKSAIKQVLQQCQK
jgi:dTDP-4-amino-4,6-dideoxygalactose transaminase